MEPELLSNVLAFYVRMYVRTSVQVVNDVSTPV